MSSFATPQIKPKKFEERDVDIQIDACGVCGSDVHTIVSSHHNLHLADADDAPVRTQGGVTPQCHCALGTKSLEKPSRLGPR